MGSDADSRSDGECPPLKSGSARTVFARIPFTMMSVEFRRGVHLPTCGLWLDPRDPAALAFVSHAHSDHTGRHARTIATPVTWRLMKRRMGGLSGGVVELPFGERRDFGAFAMTLIPAGHVLGSAQALVEGDGGSLLYTGDFKLRAGASAERAEFVGADTLVMETTYGMPKFVFPPTEKVLAGILKFCVEALEEDAVPVLLGYSLGKAQEVLASLAGKGLTAMVHGSVASMIEVYRAEGVAFPETLPWKPAAAAGCVLVAPPSLAGSRALASIPNRRVAAVTGWALEPGAVHRWRCDAAFPLSDHAGFDDLLRHVENVRPRRVLTLHGYAVEFARELRDRGFEAWALTAPNQLELAIPRPVCVSFLPEEGGEAAEAARDGLAGFAGVGDAVCELTGRLSKVRTLADYLGSLAEEELRLAAVWLSGRAFSSGDNVSHGAGWAVVKSALRSASGLAEGELREISRRWNDSGRTVGEVMRSRGGKENPSLKEAAGVLRALRAARGPHAKTEVLAEFFRRVDASASRYLVKILSGDLRIGLKEGLLEEAVAAAFGVDPAAVREANMLVGDLGEIACRARSKTLDQVRLKLLRPIKCMLASPEPGAEEVWERLGGRVWLDQKFDGIRAQIHAAEGRAEIFTRDLHPVGEAFPELVAAAVSAGREIVLDGEILAWSGGRPAAFAELQKRLGRTGGDLFLGAELPVVFVAFDLLHLAGETLLWRPLRERRARLEALGLAEPLRVASLRIPASAGEIDLAFDEARRSGYEGLVAKDPESHYLPGRRGGAWIKLNKRFATLDVVVTAVEYGHGRRREVLSDYTFAVRDDSSGRLVTIGKAYSGLTDAEIRDLTGHFLAHAKAQTGNRIEVEPNVVLEIAFDAIRPSRRHASGLALRFPRIARIRKDKTFAEIDSLATARRLAGI